MHAEEIYPQRVSVSSDGDQANNDSSGPAISTDGRYVAFSSDASNLVPNDTNGTADIFVHDRDTGNTSRVSVSSNGEQANSVSYSFLTISADGRYVAFSSAASNLVTNDTNGVSDVFVHDRETGQTLRVSVGFHGEQADYTSEYPTMSADGRYVAFSSDASNLVTNDTNGNRDIFVHDRDTGNTSRVSVGFNGEQADYTSEYPTMSADGRYVAFSSDASNLVTNDTNGAWDIFVRDRDAGETTRVSINSDGGQANDHSQIAPSISADGRYVAFHSMASNLVPNDTNGNWGIFVHDRDTGNTSHVSVSSDGEQANGFSFGPSISADGRYVAFVSGASNLVTNDTDRNWDIFVRDRDAGKTTRVSVSTDEQQANDFSFWPSISADGRYVAFYSEASNLVPNDTNGSEDVFITKNFLYGGIITPPPPPPPTGDNHSPTITFSNDSGFQTDYVNPNKGTTVTDFQWL